VVLVTDDDAEHAGRTEYTRADLLDRVRRTATLLRQRGVVAGDRVGVMSANRVEIVDLLLACGWIGAVFVPFNPANRAGALVHQLVLAEPAVVFADESSRPHLEAALAEAAGPDDARVRPEVTGFSVTLPAETADADPDVAPSTLLALLWTSGTTGPSKAVQIPHGQFFWWPVVVTEEMALTSEDVLYTCLPLYHTNALTTPLQALACGGTAVLGPHFSVSRHWDRLAAAGATVTYLLGAMGTMLWNRRPQTLPPLRLDRVLGGGMGAHLKTDFERFFGLRVLEGFGMTELGVPIYTPVEDPDTTGMGVLHPDFDAAVVDDHHEECPAGVTGELVVRARRPYAISTGYWRNERATAESRANLWFHTGDLVVRDEHGCFRFVGRRSDSIRRRGENISAFEVESAVGAVPGVSACAAYAVPSDLGEDEVMVSVVRTDHTLNPADLLEHTRTLLAAHALPRYVRFVGELPLTGNGKIRKGALRELGVTTDSWDSAASTADRGDA